MGINVLILGGAGFIGSNIANELVEQGYNVIVIDGLLPKTGGKIENLVYMNKIEFINKKIEEIHDLEFIVKDNDYIIDCIGWTLHLEAINNPCYDLELNCKSHLLIIKALKKDHKVIYLGSRGQYGNPSVDIITENTEMYPEDIQGIHKLTTEYYYKFYSNIIDFDCISLRLPNCFGENQLINSDEIGLIGSFIRDTILGKPIEIFGTDRIRAIIYVKDVVKAILCILNYKFKQFNVFNINGYNKSILELAKLIIEVVGSGDIFIKDIPESISKIDVGNALFSDKKFRDLFPEYKPTDLKISLENTINYFKRKLL